VKPDGQWLWKVAKYGPCILIHWQNRPAFSMAKPVLPVRPVFLSDVSVCASVCDHWTQRKVMVDAEKSDGKKKSDSGRREK